VFDVDGTLVAFKFDVKGTRTAIIEELSKRGFDTSKLDMTTPTQTMIDAAVMQVEAGRFRGDFAEVRARLYSILDASEIETSKSASVLPGARATLDYMKSKGVRMGVVTNSGRIAADDMLRRAELQGYFEFVLCRDDVSAMKPKPDGLERALSILGVPRERVFYVGDSKYDIIAAKEARVKIIAIPSGNYTEARLKEEGADYVVASISELPRLLGV